MGWQTIETRPDSVSSSNKAPAEEFHSIIGKRYSDVVIHDSPIAEAKLPTTYKRQYTVDVTLDWAPGDDTAKPVDPKKMIYRFNLPYQLKPQPVQTFTHRNR